MSATANCILDANSRPVANVLRLDHRLLHGLDDALFDHHTRLGCVLQSFLRRPLGANRQTERSLVLLSGLEGVRELGGQIFIVLDGGVKY